MIKIRKKTFAYSISALAIVIMSTIFAFHYFITEKIYCTADLVVHKNNDIVKVSLTYNLSNHIGNFDMVGELYRDNKIIGIISRNIISTYTANNFNYRFTSESIDTTAMDTLSDDILAEYMPKFFIKPNQSMSLNINRIKSSGWIISTNSVPFLMCNKI